MTLVAIVVGAVVGTALRLGVDLLLPHTDSQFPASTLAANVIGSFMLGVLVARFWPIAPDWLRAGLGAGLLGSFTTFSAVAVSLVSLASAGEWALVALYAAASLVLGLTAAFLGLHFGRPAPIDLVGE